MLHSARAVILRSRAVASSPPTVTVRGTGTNAAATGGTCAFTATVANRGILLILTRTGGLATGALTGVTDNATGGTNTYRVLTRGAVSGVSNTRIELWYSPNAKSASSLSFTSGTSQAGAFEILELANVDAAGTITAFSPDNSATTSSTSVTTPSINAGAGDLVIAAAHYGLTSSPLSSAAFTALTNFDDAAGSGRAAYQVMAAAAAVSATWSPLASAKAAGVATVAFKAA